APTLAADEAGRITSAIGVVSVQRTDGSMAVLSKGSAVTVGDTLRTQAESRAEIQTQDRARVIVRPDSTFKIEGYRFTQSAPQDDSTVLRLLKGGLRSISGLLGQRRPAAYQLNTATATIGIRGTDFVVRECQDDCAQETREAAKTLTPRTPGYVARVVAVQGSLTTSSGTRAGKPLAVGAPIYAEDLLETGPKSHAALIFQDGTRVVLQADTRFAVNGYRYEPSKAETGSLSLRLLRGGLRVLTGLIGQRNPQRFQVTTSVATIGIRGTGFDVTCTGPCTEGEGAQSTADVPDGLHVYTWRGRNVTSTEPGETETVEDQALIVTSRTDLPRLLESVPASSGSIRHPVPTRSRSIWSSCSGCRAISRSRAPMCWCATARSCCAVPVSAPSN
ncbi:MAG: FecR domain-containing protein, partial [Burkholderiales bacterium]|nr:FecR domain-containing protein [Burkholderiales bacterium]